MKPIDKFLNALPPSGERRSESDGSWMVVCPAHEDNNPSLHVTEDQSGKLLLNCFKGCKAPAICYSVGLTISELFPDHGQSRSSGSSSRKKSKTRERLNGKKKVAEFDYRDADGVAIYQTVRFEDEATGEKTFVQRRPNGKGGWIPNLRGIDVVLYRLPELIAGDKSQPVFILEGEKKVEALRNWGLIATCNTGGAGKWKKEYAKFFRNRDVYILPDDDPTDPKTGVNPGLDHARKIISTLTDIAKSVRILTLPDLPPKGDVIDWIANGGNLPKLMELIQELNADGESAAKKLEAESQAKSEAAAASAGDPLALNREEEILAAIKLEVLGEIADSGGAIKVFSEDHRKSDIIKEVGKLSLERLMQICGPIVKQKVHLSSDEIPGSYPLAEVKKAIALASGYRRIDMGNESGRGVWRGIGNNREPNQSVILVGSGEAAKWNGKKILERITKPRSEGRILDLGCSDPWYDFQHLAGLMQDTLDPEFCKSTIRETEKLFSRWEWKFEDSPSVVVGLILATWIQTLWDWRPQIAINGESKSGKSSLFKCLREIFGPLALSSSGSSAAGIRQKMKTSAPAALLDEFDTTKDRQEIMKMLRSASRGDTIFRGTTTHKGQEFTMQHIVWTAGIESGLKDQADRNRFILLELVQPKFGNQGKLVIPSHQELSNLGQRLLAISVRHALSAVDVASSLRKTYIEGIDSRVIESYAVPAAIIGAAYEMDFDTTEGLMGKLLRTAKRETNAHGDKEQLVEDIFSSKIHTGKEQVSVEQAICWRNGGGGYVNALAAVGIAVFEDGIFIAHNVVLRHLLKSTKWELQNIDEILTRLPGARECRKRFVTSKQYRGILLTFESVGLSDDDISPDTLPLTG